MSFCCLDPPNVTPTFSYTFYQPYTCNLETSLKGVSVPWPGGNNMLDCPIHPTCRPVNEKRVDKWHVDLQRCFCMPWHWFDAYANRAGSQYASCIPEGTTTPMTPMRSTQNQFYLGSSLHCNQELLLFGLVLPKTMQKVRLKRGPRVHELRARERRGIAVDCGDLQVWVLSRPFKVHSL